MTATEPATVNVTNVEHLTDKTVFLKVRFGVLGNSRKVSGETVLDTDADKELLKVSKTLLDSPELDAIRKADGKMRQWLYNTCLPYDIGIQLLPTGLITATETRLQQFKTTREGLVESFLNAYAGLCEKAAKHLGSLYNPNDYPSKVAVSSRFVFDWQYVSFGVPGQLKSISSEIFEAQKSKAEAVMAEAAEEITLLMRQTMFDMVSHLRDRLTPGDDGKPRILRETAIENLREFLNTFELRNVTDDKQLSAVVAKCKGLLSGVNADGLRNSDVFRDKVKESMAMISATLGTMVEEKSGRKFREE